MIRRYNILFATAFAALAIGSLPMQTWASVDNYRAPDLPIISGNQLALSEVGDIIPDNKPGGTLSVPETGDDTGIPAITDDDAAPADTLETDVSEDKHHSATTANVTVSNDLSKLPKPVERMRELIVEAAATGNIEGLRPLLGVGSSRTVLSIGGYEGDPIDFLKEISGDGQGRELLAILLDIFQTGYAHLDAGEPTEMYLWPYFYAVPIDSLDDRQMVELYRVITAGDYEDMQAFGGYIFYRTAISPDGQWKFFVAGD